MHRVEHSYNGDEYAQGYDGVANAPTNSRLLQYYSKQELQINANGEGLADNHVQYDGDSSGSKYMVKQARGLL